MSQASIKGGAQSAVVKIARDYYNSDDAEHFYSQIWGGEDIHIGLYETSDEAISEASHRTVVTMAKRLPELNAQSRVIDLGSGYCGAARYLAKTYSANVAALNLSEVENQRARELNKNSGLSDNIQVHDGSFETMPFDDATSQVGFDVAWSQDAILHSGNRQQVFTEVSRVLKPGGYFIFTDPMQSDDCPEGVLQPILDRIHLSSLGSPAYYRDIAQQVGLEVRQFDDQTTQLINHYRRVLEETERHTAELEKKIDSGYIERMKAGLQRWITGGQSGHLAWGIFLLQKPN